jgi:outer membrane protein assembly factor BamA/autotransporter translocation and assembly factor TamB
VRVLTFPLARWFGRIAAALLLAIVLIGLAALSWPARDAVRAWAASWASDRLGAPVFIKRLQYDLRTPAIIAEDVAVLPATSGATPLLFARRLAIDLSWRTLLRGRVTPLRIDVSDLDASTAVRGTAVGVQHVDIQLTAREAGGFAGRLAVDRSARIRIGTLATALRELAGVFTVAGQKLTIESFRTSFDEFAVDGEGTVDAAGDDPRLAVRGSLRGDLPALCALVPPSGLSCSQIREGSVMSRFAVEGPLSAPTVRADLATEDLRTAAGWPNEVTGSVVVRGSSVDVPNLRLTALGGSAMVRDGRLDLASRATSAMLTWQDVDLRRIAAAAGVSMPIAASTRGQATVSGDPLDPKRLTIAADAEAVPAAGGVPGSGRVVMRFDRGAWSTQISCARVGPADLEGEARWSASSIAGTVRVSTADLQATLQTAHTLRLLDHVPDEPWPIRGTTTLALGGSPRAPRAAGTIHAMATPPRGPEIDASADASFDSHTVQLTAIDATHGESHLTGSLRYDTRSGALDGDVSATAPDVSQLASLGSDTPSPIQGHGTADAHIFGTAADPRVHATARLEDVMATSPVAGPDGAPVAVALGEVELELTAEEQIDVRLAAPAQRLTASGVMMRDGDWPFEMMLTADDADVATVVAAIGSPMAIDGKVDGTLMARGSARSSEVTEARVDLTRAEGTVNGVDVVLAQPAHLRLESGKLADAQLDMRVGDLSVQIGGTGADEPMTVRASGPLPPSLAPEFLSAPEIALEARLDRGRVDVPRASIRSGGMTAEGSAQAPRSFVDGWLPAWLRGQPQTDDQTSAVAQFDVKGLPLGVFAQQYAGSTLGLTSNTIDGTLDAALTVTALQPSLDAVHAEGRLERGSLTVGGARFEQSGIATVTVDEGRAAMTEWRWVGSGTDLTIAGESPVADAASQFQATLAGNVDLGAIGTIGGERVAGKAHLDVSAHGGTDRVRWSGQAQVQDGAWVAGGRGFAITDVDATLSCSEEHCQVDQFDGRLNGGTLAISGELPIGEGAHAGTFRATLEGAGLEWPEGTRHDVDATLEIADSGEPRLTGTVTIWPGAIDGSIVSLASAASSLQTSQRSDPGATPSPLMRIPLDVRVVTGDDLTFDGQDLQGAATADLRVRGTLAAPQLRGQVAALERGKVFLAGRMWDIEEGNLNLTDSAAGTDMRISASISARISRYTVRMRMSGPASQPNVTMTSDPALGQGDLAELVLTGSVTGDSTKGSSQQLAGSVSGALLSSAGRKVGIDAVRIEQHQSELSTADIEPVSRLTMSKRVTNRADIVYSQGLNDSDDQAWILVYRPGWRQLDLRATVRTNGAEAYELRQELEFGAAKRADAATRVRRELPLVERVDIDGISPEEASLVREHLSLKDGTRFATDKWQRDREAVRQFFHERNRLAVRVRASRMLTPDGAYLLTYRVTPGPTVKLEVKGYAVPKSTLTTLRETWSHAIADDLIAGDLTDVLRVDLAKQGYLQAEVVTRVSSASATERLATIDVTRGRRTTSRKIVFEGNSAIPTTELRDLLSASRVEPRCWVEPAIVEAPVGAFYRSRGYLAAVPTTRRTLDGHRATLTVRVDEGAPFTVGTLAISGTPSIGEAAARTSFGLAPGDPFADALLTTAVARLHTAYARAGYLDATVTPAVTIARDRGVVDITVAIAEGTRSILRDVAVTGRDETSEHLIDQLVDAQPDRPVDPVGLDAAQQRLYRTGIFRTVDVQTQPIEAPTPAPAAPSIDATPAVDAPPDATPSLAPLSDRDTRAIIAVEERAKYRLRYGLQFGPSAVDSITTASDTAEPGGTFDIQRRNLLGVGIVAGGGGVWSATQHRVRATVSTATLYGRFISTAFTIEQANQDRTSPPGLLGTLQVRDRSLRSVLEQRWRAGVTRRVELAYGAEVESHDVALQATHEVPLPIRGRIADLNATITYDSRDNRLNPHSGTFHSSRVEWGGGFWLSDFPFFRYQGQHTIYRPVGTATFASGVRFGSLAMNAVGEPASLLLFFKAGGGTSVRGYDTDTLTPAYVLGLPAGGKVLLVFNEELRIPVTKRFGVVTFADAGNTFEGLDQVAARALKLGIGSGLRVDTPVAVLRFDVGLPVPRPQGSPWARWYLSIGQAF